MCARQWALIIHDGVGPSEWVRRFADLIPPKGLVLDWAAGSGRHSIYLINQGYRVHALDRNTQALAEQCAKLPNHQQESLHIKTMDLEGADFPIFPERYDGLIVTNYLYRPFLPNLLNLLNESGVLIYETFGLGNETFGKPSNPDFLLKSHELVDWVRGDSGYQVVAFEQGQVSYPKPAVIQRICAVRSPSIPLQLTNERKN